MSRSGIAPCYLRDPSISFRKGSTSPTLWRGTVPGGGAPFTLRPDWLLKAKTL